MLRFRVLLSAVVILSRAMPAQTVEVNEKATRLVLRSGQGSVLMLAVNSRGSQPLNVRLHLEVLDSTDKIEGQAEKEQTIPVGEYSIKLPFSCCDRLIAESTQEVLWYRRQ